MAKEYRRYDDSLKERAVAMHTQEGMSLHRIARELGVSDASVIRKWVRAKQRYGDDWLRERRGRPRLMVDGQERPQRTRLTLTQARARVQQLEAENLALLARIEELEELA